LSVPPKNLASKIVNDSQSGLVADSNDLVNFIKFSELLYKNQELRVKFANNARNYAETNFNIENISEKFVQVFNTLI